MKKLALIVSGICAGIIIGAAIVTNRPVVQIQRNLNMTYPYKLPPLPYHYNALEPYIDEMTMRVHHTKHHQTYIDNLNNALEKYPELQQMSLDELLTHIDTLPESVRTTIRNNGGGHLNHSMFWHMMKPNGGGKPKPELASLIDGTFGDFETFKEQFNAKAKSVFGSGWAWLCCDDAGELKLVATPNQDAPISDGLSPILGLDVWEHAYYLKYQNKRPDYIGAWWNVINWDYVQELFDRVKK